MVTLNTHISLFGPAKHAKHFDKMAELAYAELTQGRDSTYLPHTHKFMLLKNVVISALQKLINEYIFKPKCNCRRMSMQKKKKKKKKRTHNGCLVQIESPVTQDKTVWHHSASLAMLNGYRRD